MDEYAKLCGVDTMNYVTNEKLASLLSFASYFSNLK